MDKNSSSKTKLCESCEPKKKFEKFKKSAFKSRVMQILEMETQGKKKTHNHI